MYIFLTMFITLIAITICIFLFKKKNKKLMDRKNAEFFVNELERLAYFKYTDQSDYLKLKQYITENFSAEGAFDTEWKENADFSTDYRYYFCDGESVFEQDGISNLLKTLAPVFAKMSFNCEITNHLEEWDYKNKCLNHAMTINGSKYIIFHNFKGFGWGEAPYRIVQILNQELEKQNIDERFYLINGGNDGWLALLSDAQYQLMDKTYKDKRSKPLQLDEWAKEFEVVVEDMI